MFKTDKGRILKFVVEAREYVNDDSIDEDSVEEFILFDDPDIFNKIAAVQKKEGEKIQDEVKDGEVDVKQVANSAEKAAKIGAAGSIASSAITAGANVATSKAALGLAASIGYKKVLDKAAEIGDAAGTKVGDTFADVMGYNDNKNAGIEAKKVYDALVANNQQALADYSKISNLGRDASSLKLDKRAMMIAKSLQSGDKIMAGGGGKAAKYMSPDQAKEWLTKNGYEIGKDGVVNKVTSAATGAASAGAAGAATTAAGASTGGWSLFGLSAATVGWIAAGVAAAAIITPYIYDKVRACTKTWMADIIAEVKFKADGKNYRCFYDLKKNKWVLVYADVKWTSYLDNKLDQETIDEFFASKFFAKFLSKCKAAFAMLFSTGKNEVVFKALPEIKDAPKDLKDILEKIYDNKGAISRNMFAGEHI